MPDSIEPPSAPSLRAFTRTPEGWKMGPPARVQDGALAISIRGEGPPRLVRMHDGQEQVLQGKLEGREAADSFIFILGAVICAPEVTSTVPAARAGRPSRSSRRLLVFSPARWQWEDAERTGARTGDVFRLVERSGKPVLSEAKMEPPMFRWTGASGAEVPYELNDLGAWLSDSEVIAQGAAWLGLNCGLRSDEAAVVDAERPAAALGRRRRRVLPSPPPPARRALSTATPDEADEADPVDIPQLPPEPPAIDDDPTQEFPNMPANRAPQAPNPPTELPGEITLREITDGELREVRALYENGKMIEAVDYWMTARGWPEGTAREAEADLLAALGRRKPQAPARRGRGDGVPDLQLLRPPPIIESPPIEPEERASMERAASYSEPADYDTAQPAAAAEEVIIEPGDEPKEAEAPAEPAADSDGAEQLRTVKVGWSFGVTPREGQTVDEDGAEPDAGFAAYDSPPEGSRPIRMGDVVEPFGVCVSLTTRVITVVLTDEEREHYVIELTEMPSRFAALEEKKRKFMEDWKREKEALRKEETALGQAVCTYKENREVEVAGLLRAEWVTEVNAQNPAHKLGTRRPNENDKLQISLFDARQRDDEDNGAEDDDE